jgi:uncharacterized protein
MVLRLAVLAIWLAASAGFVGWSARHTFHIGRMILPRVQAVAIALAIVVCATLVLCWGWMAVWSVAKRAGWARGGSWVDRPVVRYALASLLLALPLLLLYGRHIEPRWVVVRELTIGRAPPPGQQPVRLTVISDLHTDAKRRPWLGLAEHVNTTAPDVILFLGDTLNRPRALPQLRQMLGAMRARHGKYAVRGNWEAWYWNYLPLLRGTGFTWLDGDAVSLQIRGQRIDLVGYPFDDEENGAEAQGVLAALPKTAWRVFLYHTPDLVEAVPAADLYLAGHTHGGQIAVPFFGALVTLSKYGKRFERGLSRVGRTQIYVNPGIGVEPLIPLRLGVRPEVTVLKLGRPER